MEGVFVLSPSKRLVVTDIDFSVAAARTRFSRVSLAAPLA